MNNLEKFMGDCLDNSIQGINLAVAIKQKELTEKDAKIKELQQKSLQTCTNKQLLQELGRRVIFNRLELEENNIWDNEWEDKTKPDYTGARTNLVYWLTEAKHLMEKEVPHE